MAIEVRHRKPGTKLDNRKADAMPDAFELAVVLDRSAESLWWVRREPPSRRDR